MKRFLYAPGFNLCGCPCTALLAAGLISPLLSAVAQAETTTVTNSLSQAWAPISASARLRFEVSLGSFVSLQVGAPVTTINTASFDLTPLVSGCSAAPCQLGTGTPVAATYDGGFGAAGLPVKVRSNAGAVSLAATVGTPLANGAATVPFSQVKIVSSDASLLPAPNVPDSGVGPAVTVAQTAPNSRLTNAGANWSFSYANTVVPSAGIYNGQVTFTASTP